MSRQFHLVIVSEWAMIMHHHTTESPQEIFRQIMDYRKDLDINMRESNKNNRIYTITLDDISNLNKSITIYATEDNESMAGIIVEIS